MGLKGFAKKVGHNTRRRGRITARRGNNTVRKPGRTVKKAKATVRKAKGYVRKAQAMKKQYSTQATVGVRKAKATRSTGLKKAATGRKIVNRVRARI